MPPVRPTLRTGGAPLATSAECLASALYWRGDYAELLHQAQIIRRAPVLHNLAARQVLDIDSGDYNQLAGRGSAHHPPWSVPRDVQRNVTLSPVPSAKMSSNVVIFFSEVLEK